MVGENGVPETPDWTLPEYATARQALLAEARAIYGLDLSDDDRAAVVRARRRRPLAAQALDGRGEN